MKHSLRSRAVQWAGLLLAALLLCSCAASPVPSSAPPAETPPPEQTPELTSLPLRGIYTGQETGDYTELLFTLEDEVPELLRIRATLPGVAASVPQAEQINAAIKADFDSLLSLTRENYGTFVQGFSSPVYELDYTATEFDGLLQLCVIKKVYSAAGSGVITALNRYAIELETGALLSGEDFATRRGLSNDEIVEGFCAAFDISPEKAAELGYTTENILAHCFYLTPSGEVTFLSNLYA